MVKKTSTRFAQMKATAAPLRVGAKGSDGATVQKAPDLQTLNALKAAAVALIEAKNWTGLADVGRTPLTKIIEPDRVAAREWLLRTKIAGLTQNHTLDSWRIGGDVAAELRATLALLAKGADRFYQYQEFWLYVNLLQYSLEDSVTGFFLLQEACAERVCTPWILKLRLHVQRLLEPESFSEDALTSQQQALLATLPNASTALSDAYAMALTDGNLDEENTTLVKVLQCELDLQLAEPWAVRTIIDRLASLPSPSQAELSAARADGPRFIGNQLLTPIGLAFLWDVRHTPLTGYPELLARYPTTFGCDGFDGLRLIVQCLVARPPDIDGLLAAATCALMKYLDEAPNMFGTDLTVPTLEGTKVAIIGPRELVMADIAEALLRVVEQQPQNFVRENELVALYRVFNAAPQILELEDDPNTESALPGLAWLCDQSIAFQFQAAIVVQGVAARVTLLLNGIYRCLTTDAYFPYRYYPRDLKEILEPAQAAPLIEHLSKLVPLRESIGGPLGELWYEIVGDIFRLLSQVSGTDRDRLWDIAVEFENDLLVAEESFLLGYLAQTTGYSEAALQYYLIDVDSADELRAASVKNAELLWAKSETPLEVEAFVSQLNEAATSSQRPDVVKQLLKSAKARLASLRKEDQYEKTAVNRWPAITETARKLLGVFATIQRYNGFEELGEYAGMNAFWAEKHYNKLVETGMLFVSDTGYRINPYIEPLLARESQHAIVGRIVRSQGTSAVKQVFNSQREFSIYQVMVQLCPNHLVFPNSSLQSIMSYDRMKELVSEDDFGYYLRASIDVVVVSSTTYLPMLAIEVDSVWHDTERQQKNDDKKDRIFAAAGIPFMRLRPVGKPSANTIRVQVAEHLDVLVRTLRSDFPGYAQARVLLEDLSSAKAPVLPD